MERLLYDGQMVASEYSTCYVFTSKNIDDAADIFYELYEDDIESVAVDYKLSDEDVVMGVVVALEVNDITKNVTSVLLSISIETDGEECEYEVTEIELDEESIEVLMDKIID